MCIFTRAVAGCNAERLNGKYLEARRGHPQGVVIRFKQEKRMRHRSQILAFSFHGSQCSRKVRHWHLARLHQCYHGDWRLLRQRYVLCAKACEQQINNAMMLAQMIA
jgi:hypothetical protein